MKCCILRLITAYILTYGVCHAVYGQAGVFENNWRPLTFAVPEQTVAVAVPGTDADVIVSIDAADTVNKVLPTIFGNNCNAWVRKDPVATTLLTEDSNALRHIRNLAIPTMRIPGGNWSNLWLWDGTLHWLLKEGYEQEIKSGPTTNWTMTTDELLALCTLVGSEPQICVNYSLARYIDEPDPVAKAAQYAAEWVRDVNGTKQLGVRYWEIGNENYGKWQAGYVVEGDTLSARTYGEDFRVFADSMKAADPTIKIGAVLFPRDSGTNVADWSRDVLPLVQDHADFLVIHEYFTWASDINSITADQVLEAKTTIAEDIANVHDMTARYTEKPSGYFPVALTEYNMRAGEKNTTHVSGLFMAEALGECIKSGYGLVNIWGIINSNGFDDHGMLARGEGDVVTYTPHPSFFSYYYFRKCFGDVMINAQADDASVFAYASRFSDGHLGVVVVNEADREKVVSFSIGDFQPGDRFFRYEITADSLISRRFTINGHGAETGMLYGPEQYESITPFSTEIGAEGVTFTAAKYSVNYLVITPEELSEVHAPGKQTEGLPGNAAILTVGGRIRITVNRSSVSTVSFYDLAGKSVYARSFQSAGKENQGITLPLLKSGVYLYRICSGLKAEVGTIVVR